jgi:hypothetical protein
MKKLDEAREHFQALQKMKIMESLYDRSDADKEWCESQDYDFTMKRRQNEEKEETK